jgi:hypothetical protein
MAQFAPYEEATFARDSNKISECIPSANSLCLSRLKAFAPQSREHRMTASRVIMSRNVKKLADASFQP